MSTRPTLVLVPGMCATAESWFSRVSPLLQAKWYPIVHVRLPSLDPKKPEEATALKDIDHIRKAHLLPLVEVEHRDVIVITHSYGGTCAPPAATGLSKTDRLGQGLKGGVLGLVLISGNIVGEGLSLQDVVGGAFPSWLILDNPAQGLAIVDPLIDTYFHDADLALESELKSAHLPHGYLYLQTKVSTPCWVEQGYTSRLAFVRTLQDRVNPRFAQDAMMGSTGVHWEVIDMDTAHAAMVSQPQQLVTNLETLIARFEGLGAGS